MLLVAGKRMCLGGSTWPSPNVLAKKPTISPASCLALLTCAAANGSSEIARRRGRRNLPASTSSLQRKENVSALYPTLWACKILKLDLMRGIEGSVRGQSPPKSSDQAGRRTAQIDPGGISQGLFGAGPSAGRTYLVDQPTSRISSALSSSNTYRFRLLCF